LSEAFVKIDLHGLRQEEAMKVIDKAIASAGPATYQLQLIHGYNRGTSLKNMINKKRLNMKLQLYGFW
jgi:DNA-nicking Smr family endonuclease